ncbi:MAG: 6-carboxytetrahydropterin synthase QueD [Phycisphaera sp.]|nr:6-carboxytetrahydropterin synthase QueD [Phycisphaera sp.]
MYEVTIQRVFAAAHAIRLYDGSVETLHGHNWPVEVTVACEKLDDMEVVMDFHLLEKLVDGAIKPFHNANLNELEPFLGFQVNPTAERIAEHIGKTVAKGLPDHARLIRSSVGEAPGCIATYRP